MPDSLPALEERRSRIILEIAQLGDFRPGSIHAQFRRCGKPNCACAHDDNARHGPLMRLSRKVAGKTVQVTLSEPAQLRKAQREVDTFRRFQQLSSELVQVNERICELHPVPVQEQDEPAAGAKKTLRAIQDAVSAEVGQLLNVIARAQRKRAGCDLEALEQATRAALHRAGTRLLQELLDQPAHEGAPLRCSCGQAMRCAGPRPKRLISLLGTPVLQRPYYHCRRCWLGRTPRDAELDIAGTQYSPGVRRRLAVVGGETSFERGRTLLAELADLAVSTKAVERQAEAIGADIAARTATARRHAALAEFPLQTGAPIPTLCIEMDGTGIPVTSAAAKHCGKQSETATTREVKLGCVFTQTELDAEGRLQRDRRSTTYTGAIEDAAAFGQRIYHEAWQRGLHRAGRQVVLGDGAAWV